MVGAVAGLVSCFTWARVPNGAAPNPNPPVESGRSGVSQASALPDRNNAQKYWDSPSEERADGLRSWMQLGDSLMQRSRETADASLYERAESAYRRALAFDPHHVPALVGMAWVSNSKHDFSAGRSWAKEALAQDPNATEAHALLGDAAVETGDYDEAFDHYQTCLDERPNLASYARSAHLLWLTGDSRRAKALMLRALNAGGPHAENSAWCRAELALMMLNEGALVPAEKQAEQAFAEAPNNPHVLGVVGRIKTARQDYPASIRYYEQALAIVPQHATMAALTDLYALTGEPAKSAQMFQRVLDFHAPGGPGHPHSHTNIVGATNAPTHGNIELARFLADHDRNLEEALRLAELAAESSKSVSTEDTLAWCYHKRGRNEEAQKVIRKALRWNTPDASILFHAGMIQAAAGDRPAAQKYLYQALNLNPNFHPTQAQIAAETLKHLSAVKVSAESPQQTNPAIQRAPRAP